MVEKILLAIEAMSEVDEMAAAADKHGYHLRVLAEDAAYYGDTEAEMVTFPTRNHDELATYIEKNRASASPTRGVSLHQKFATNSASSSLVTQQSLSSLGTKKLLNPHSLHMDSPDAQIHGQRS